MKTGLVSHPSPRGRKAQRAYALIIVMALAAASILIYASAANWTSTSAGLNDRNNAYNRTVGAAEAATETVLAYMARDFFNQTYDPTRMAYYGSFIPTNSWTSSYRFSDGAGTLDTSYVNSSTTMVLTNLDSQFAGLYGLAYTCTVRGNARLVGPPYNIAAAVQQDFQLATIPVFQFAIFYSMDLEINPGAPMKITGKVHSNANIYSGPPAALEYVQDVDAVGKIYTNRAPYDPTGGSITPPTYDISPVPGSSSITMPIATNNSPTTVRQITDPPPVGESPNSPMGSARYYNQVDLIITTTSTSVTVQSGSWDNFATVPTDIPATNGATGYSFIQTNSTFYDEREQKMTLMTDVNVGALTNWMRSPSGGQTLNTRKNNTLGKNINSIYVIDKRTGTGKMAAVRVSNGQTLPPDGLTIATPDPIYVWGNYNAADLTPGSTNTSSAKPASLVGDSITVLSGSWLDSRSPDAATTTPTQMQNYRIASQTTVNAAFLAGIVQPTNTTGTLHYSGGVENFPRFLENWSGLSFTYNGSMVVMFPSRYATNYWIGPGTYYNAPNRKWAFDVNFLDYRKLPPATPQVRKLVRGHWNVVAAQ